MSVLMTSQRWHHKDDVIVTRSSSFKCFLTKKNAPETALMKCDKCDTRNISNWNLRNNLIFSIFFSWNNMMTDNEIAVKKWPEIRFEILVPKFRKKFDHVMSQPDKLIPLSPISVWSPSSRISRSGCKQHTSKTFWYFFSSNYYGFSIINETIDVSLDWSNQGSTQQSQSVSDGQSEQVGQRPDQNQ